MVSIKDIASSCGFSIATVSKALNNHKDVSENTKIIIHETAKKLGYLPNIQARSLKTNRTYNLGVLFAEKAQSGLTHSYFSAILNSFKNEAENCGYDITFIGNNIGNSKMTYYEHCFCRNVDGVFVVCVDDFKDAEVVELLDSSVPVVTLDYCSNNNPAVLSDNCVGMRILVDYICSNGHKKTAFIYGEMTDVTKTRLKCFKETMQSHNFNINDEYIIQGRYLDPNLTEKLVEQLVKLADPPTCIILPDDFSALGAFNAFEKLGISIPDDISIAGYDGILLSQVLNPKLTTYRQDTEKLGSEAAKLLISLIQKEITGVSESIIVNGNLLKGLSVKKL